MNIVPYIYSYDRVGAAVYDHSVNNDRSPHRVVEPSEASARLRYEINETQMKITIFDQENKIVRIIPLENLSPGYTTDQKRSGNIIDEFA